MTQRTRLTGMLGFTLVWIGQVVSLLGTGMTRFALTIWAWQITGSATALALVGFFSFGPVVLLGPIAGALVDRWNRKLVMMFSDLAAGLSTIVVLVLYAAGNLQIWHLYVAGAFAGTFESFQWPAYSAAITMMLRKEQYARASGMISFAESASGIFAPLLAGILLGLIGIAGIMVIDVVTFLIAIGALLLVSIPQPTTTEAGRKGRGSLWKESAYGLRYILERPSLLGLQLIFFVNNFTFSTGSIILLAPMILARTGNDELALGSVQSAAGVGGMIGGLLLSIWGGPKRKVHGVLTSMALCLFSQFVLGLGRSLPVWITAAFFSWFFISLIDGSNQAIWQAKVAPDVQGRVFATRRLIAQVTQPVAMLLVGPLADHVFEPALMPGESLAAVFGGLVGTGPGAGMALMTAITGALGVLVALGGYTFRAVRNVEDILPDHDAEATPAAEAVA